MKTQLMDPLWKEKRDRMLGKQRESSLASQADIGDSSLPPHAYMHAVVGPAAHAPHARHGHDLRSAEAREAALHQRAQLVFADAVAGEELQHLRDSEIILIRLSVSVSEKQFLQSQI